MKANTQKTKRFLIKASHFITTTGGVSQCKNVTSTPHKISSTKQILQSISHSQHHKANIQIINLQVLHSSHQNTNTTSMSNSIISPLHSKVSPSHNPLKYQPLTLIILTLKIECKTSLCFDLILFYLYSFMHKGLELINVNNKLVKTIVEKQCH